MATIELLLFFGLGEFNGELLFKKMTPSLFLPAGFAMALAAVMADAALESSMLFVRRSIAILSAVVAIMLSLRFGEGFGEVEEGREGV